MVNCLWGGASKTLPLLCAISGTHREFGNRLNECRVALIASLAVGCVSVAGGWERCTLIGQGTWHEWIPEFSLDLVVEVHHKLLKVRGFLILGGLGSRALLDH